jgi:hypothetical protein
MLADSLPLLTAHQFAIFCERWNVLADICNGRDRLPSPDNAEQQQTHLLETLA